MESHKKDYIKLEFVFEMEKNKLVFLKQFAGVFFIFSGISAVFGALLKNEILVISFTVFLIFSFLLSVTYRVILWRLKLKENIPSYINLIIVVGLIYIFGMALAISTNRRRAVAEKNYSARYNLKLIGDTMIKYAEYNNGFLPDANNWCDLPMSYDKKLTRMNFKHPLIKEWECNIAYNKNLSGLKLSEIPKDTILIFEADGNWNLSGDEDLLRERYINNKDYLSVYIILANGKMVEYWFVKGGYRYVDSNGVLSFTPPLWKP